MRNKHVLLSTVSWLFIIIVIVVIIMKWLG